MRIRDLYKTGKTVMSLEVFPPKSNTGVSLDGALSEIARLSPAFISVTIHTSGNAERTSGIAAGIQNAFGIPSMAHLTCVNADRNSIQRDAELIRSCGVENILALRGDAVGGGLGTYRFAEELIRSLPKTFCIGAACYPEGHIESVAPEKDIEYLKRKEDAGAEFFLSQLFFENDVFLRFIERVKNFGITAPVSAGVMPVLSKSQIEKMIFLCGASLPARVIRLLHKYQDNQEDLRKAGVEYAAEQVRGLCDRGVDGVHVYTMNKPEVARWIFSR